jgi:hypothetical protein
MDGNIFNENELEINHKTILMFLFICTQGDDTNCYSFLSTYYKIMVV